MKKYVYLFGVILAMGILFLCLFYVPARKIQDVATQKSRNAKQPPAAKPVESITPARIAMTAPKAEELAPIHYHPMADAIGRPGFPPEKEIAAVMQFFQIYRQEFGGFPAGEGNAQFMNALRGNNPTKLPIFPLTHPRLDPKGNLLDPWGKPYVFHAVSRDRLEIRSSGPDREIFTADDLTLPK